MSYVGPTCPEKNRTTQCYMYCTVFATSITELSHGLDPSMVDLGWIGSGFSGNFMD